MEGQSPCSAIWIAGRGSRCSPLERCGAGRAVPADCHQVLLMSGAPVLWGLTGGSGREESRTRSGPGIACGFLLSSLFPGESSACGCHMPLVLKAEGWQWPGLWVWCPGFYQAALCLGVGVMLSLLSCTGKPESPLRLSCATRTQTVVRAFAGQWPLRTQPRLRG